MPRLGQFNFALKLNSTDQVTPLRIFNAFEDQGNSGTIQTNLIERDVPANTLSLNGQSLEIEAWGSFGGALTATKQIRLLLGGQVAFDSNALTVSIAGAWDLRALVIRDGANSVRYKVVASFSGLSVPTRLSEGALSGANFENAIPVRITGRAQGVGAASNDILLKAVVANWIPAASQLV